MCKIVLLDKKLFQLVKRSFSQIDDFQAINKNPKEIPYTYILTEMCQKNGNPIHEYITIVQSLL